VARDYNLKDKLKRLGLNIAIQGEIIGPRIQGGMYNNAKGSTLGQNLRLYVFNVYNIDTKKYYDLASMITICDRLGLDTVPILDTDYKLPETVGEMIKYASGRSTLADCIREGVVVRAHDKSISFKAVSNEYLLKHEGKDELE
jgi:ATP-dependent RNA circularization protein (DNA/RNA ligase family)